MFIFDTHPIDGGGGDVLMLVSKVKSKVVFQCIQFNKNTCFLQQTLFIFSTSMSTALIQKGKAKVMGSILTLYIVCATVYITSFLNMVEYYL